MILNLVFLLQAAASAVFAFLLFFCLDFFTLLATGEVLQPGTTGDLAKLFARFAALGATSVVLAIAFALASARHTVRKVALLTLLALSALVAAAATSFEFQPLGRVAVGLHAGLAVAYLSIWVFRPTEI